MCGLAEGQSEDTLQLVRSFGACQHVTAKQSSAAPLIDKLLLQVRNSSRVHPVDDDLLLGPEEAAVATAIGAAGEASHPQGLP